MAIQDSDYILVTLSTGGTKALPVAKGFLCSNRPNALSLEQIAQLIDVPNTPVNYVRKTRSCNEFNSDGTDKVMNIVLGQVIQEESPDPSEVTWQGGNPNDVDDQGTAVTYSQPVVLRTV